MGARNVPCSGWLEPGDRLDPAINGACSSKSVNLPQTGNASSDKYQFNSTYYHQASLRAFNFDPVIQLFNFFEADRVYWLWFLAVLLIFIVFRREVPKRPLK
jgi:hypothetical protein